MYLPSIIHKNYKCTNQRDTSRAGELDNLYLLAFTIDRKEIRMRDPFTLDRLIKSLAGKMLAGTITKQELAELEHAKAERRQGLLQPLSLFKYHSTCFNRGCNK